MAGRPRKPTALLEVSGAYDERHGHPERRRNSEPKENRPLGDPPDRLPVEMRPYWEEIASIVPFGVLKISDRWAVELAARLMYKATSKPNIEVILELVHTLQLTPTDAKRLINDASISSAELSTLKSLLAALGMTPADRTKLSVPTEEKPKNRFADIAQESRASKSVQ